MMIDRLIEASRNVLAYPLDVPQRRHGPTGYVNYRSYKPWLRGEFAFRCVYCLTRERWRPDGQDGFSVEHVLPQTAYPDYAGDYDNLMYACNACNAYRQDSPLPIDPRQEALGNHLRVISNGSIQALTNDGEDMIDICHLGRRSLVVFRSRLIKILDLLIARRGDASRELMVDYLGFPDDIPDLSSKRPPGGNRRLDGVLSSHFAKRADGELALIY